jgi:TetR/AcrR family transcriptional regulator, transcriptional repressor for nem operon
MQNETQMFLGILEEAKRLSGEKGYNGWSYQDISNTIKITKASIHHHFPKKQDLGCAIVRHHRQLINTRLQAIDSQYKNTTDKLEALIELYAQILENGNGVCPCGMLLADMMTLPDVVQLEIKDFFADHQSWVRKILNTAAKQGVMSFGGSAQREAFVIVSFLQGALLMARLEESPSLFFKKAAQQFIQQKFR